MPSIIQGRPYAKPLFQRRKLGRRAAGDGTFTPVQVLQRYGFTKLVGFTPIKIPTIGIIELAGGTQSQDFVLSAQMDSYPAPNVTSFGIGGAGNSPGDDADGECALDGQIPAAWWGWLTGTPANLLYCYAPNTSAAFAQGITELVNRGVDMISVSWGGPDDGSDAAMEAALKGAAAAGVTVLSASGDNGSSDGTGQNATDYPASSPNGTGVGGTNLGATRETVWNTSATEGTGGGYSKYYAKPAWQIGVSGSARMIPDVACNADPATGWHIYLNGTINVFGGTSCAAPAYAGLLAVGNALRAKAGLGKIGFFAPWAFANQGAFSDIIVGKNGSFQAAPGPDPCTGVGTPNGKTFFQMLTGTGGVTPPPVIPPPVIPPPVTPPPVTSGPTEQEVLAAVDAVFARAIQQVGRFFGKFLQSLQKAVDAAIHGEFASPHEVTTGAVDTKALTLAQWIALIEDILAGLGKIPLPPTPAQEAEMRSLAAQHGITSEQAMTLLKMYGPVALRWLQDYGPRAVEVIQDLLAGKMPGV